MYVLSTIVPAGMVCEFTVYLLLRNSRYFRNAVGPVLHPAGLDERCVIDRMSFDIREGLMVSVSSLMVPSFSGRHRADHAVMLSRQFAYSRDTLWLKP